MPHFSPISWLITGLIFYFVLFLFVSLFWWLQNYKFPSLKLSGKMLYSSKWNWS